jgi:hypothetical protein
MDTNPTTSIAEQLKQLITAYAYESCFLQPKEFYEGLKYAVYKTFPTTDISIKLEEIPDSFIVNFYFKESNEILKHAYVLIAIDKEPEQKEIVFEEQKPEPMTSISIRGLH